MAGFEVTLYGRFWVISEGVKSYSRLDRLISVRLYRK